MLEPAALADKTIGRGPRDAADCMGLEARIRKQTVDLSLWPRLMAFGSLHRPHQQFACH
jgi:hypothetical protein